MRWRGLARPRRAREPMTRRPMRHLAATGYQAPRGFAGLPAPPHVPRVSPGIGPRSVVRDFLLPRWRPAQGVLRLITRFFWPSTGRVWLIHRAQRLIAACPQVDAQAYCRPLPMPLPRVRWPGGRSVPYWCAARSHRSTGIDMDTPSRRACSGRTPNPFHLVTGMGEGHLAYAESPFVRTRRRHLRCAFAGYGISRRSRAERAAEGSAAAAAMVPPPLPPQGRRTSRRIRPCQSRGRVASMTN